MHIMAKIPSDETNFGQLLLTKVGLLSEISLCLTGLSIYFSEI